MVYSDIFIFPFFFLLRHSQREDNDKTYKGTETSSKKYNLLLALSLALCLSLFLSLCLSLFFSLTQTELVPFVTMTILIFYDLKVIRHFMVGSAVTSLHFTCNRSINWSVKRCRGQHLKQSWVLTSCCLNGLRWSCYGFTCQPPCTFSSSRSGGLQWWVGFDPTSSAACCRSCRSLRQPERRFFPSFFLFLLLLPSGVPLHSSVG